MHKLHFWMVEGLSAAPTASPMHSRQIWEDSEKLEKHESDAHQISLHGEMLNSSQSLFWICLGPKRLTVKLEKCHWYWVGGPLAICSRCWRYFSFVRRFHVCNISNIRFPTQVGTGQEGHRKFWLAKHTVNTILCSAAPSQLDWAFPDWAFKNTDRLCFARLNLQHVLQDTASNCALYNLTGAVGRLCKSSVYIMYIYIYIYILCAQYVLHIICFIHII